jgi:hypothetical protein
LWEVLTMSFWKDPGFWIVVCVLGILWCIWYGTKGYGHDPKHARTDPEPEPERSPLERTTLLEDPPSSSPRSPDPFAHVDIGTVPDPDGSRYVEALRGDEVAVAAAVARERLSEPPPVPPVPFVPSLPVFSAPVPSAPLEPLPQMAVRESGAFLDRDLAGRHHKPWTGPAMTDQATGMRMPLEADRMAGVLASMKAWTPRPAVPQEPASLADLVRSAPPSAPEPAAGPVPPADATGELAFAPVMELGDVEDFIRRTFAPAEASVAATIACELDGAVPFDGASSAGLHDWDLSAPLLLPGGQRPATEADGSDAA